MLEVGQKFPHFELPNQDNHLTKLEDFANKWLVVFVYPKDDTPGCTLEGKGFSATKKNFDQMNTQIIGLSADDVASHKSFCTKFEFTIPLLADTQKKLLTALGSGQSEYKGTLYWNRTTFIVDPKGTVRKVYSNVQPEGHDQAVLSDIKQMQSIS